MAVEIAKLLNKDSLSMLLEGEDAGATQVFFKDYLCRETQGISHECENSNNYTNNFFTKHKILFRSLCIQRKRIQKSLVIKTTEERTKIYKSFSTVNNDDQCLVN